MKGKNPIRPPDRGDGNRLQIAEIFNSFQGEGPFAGIPAFFIRLGGCNLACDFCDASFENFSSYDLTSILKQLKDIEKDTHKSSLVILTGGEPLRQNIKPLCELLLDTGYHVQIETNGTLYADLDERVSIVCSPKNTSGRYKPIRKDLLPHIDAIKFIVSKTHPNYQTISEIGQSDYNIPVYLQPMDEDDPEKNHENLLYTHQMALDHNYRLSIQLQKIIGAR